MASSLAALTREIRHLLCRITGRRARAQAAAKRAFAMALAKAGPGDVLIDLGANVGEFTLRMADTGAEVYAFEPDSHALTLLRKAVAGRDNVTVIAAAASVQDGAARLYRKKSFGREPDRATKSSSLFAEKRNVSDADALQVETIDFPAFLTRLDRDIALIKIDIEGGEVPLIEALLASPVMARVSQIFVETHERGLPHLADRTMALKAAAQAEYPGRVNWDWH